LARDLARSALTGRADDLGRVGAREVGLLAQVDVRIDAAAAPQVFPRDANTWITDGDRDVLWLGPDEWLVVGVPGTEREIVEELERSLAGVHHSVVDVSAARAVIELSSDDRHELLSNGCGLDLHPRSWGNGMCAQTLLARVPVLLQERDSATRVFVRPSFAGYLVDWLVHVAGVRA
jgi:sarcosine oxidase subunit gamma